MIQQAFFFFLKCLNNFFFFFWLQLDIFQLVGAPLVENCLAGFNSSVFAYGQVPASSTFFFLFQFRFNYCKLTSKKNIVNYPANCNNAINFSICVFQKLISLDWKWKDLYDLGSSQRLVGRELIKWSTRLNSRVFERLFARINEVKIQSWTNSLKVIMKNGPILIVCALTFYTCRSKLSMLINNSSINVAVPFSR